jgi:molybdopterin/thiamine biosynthesis adenylyltransferase
MDLIPVAALDEQITIIGAGAIGGWTALALAKMGFENITVIDFDKVDTVNMNSQFYRFKDIGVPKAVALAALIEDFTGVKITAHTERYESGTFLGTVIMAVDSMQVRKLIFEQHRKRPFGTRMLIDPRMGAESALLYTVNPGNHKNCESYSKSLYTDDDAVQERCTAKATIYTANLLSGLVVKAVKDAVTGCARPLRSAQWDIAANDCMLFADPLKS